MFHRANQSSSQGQEHQANVWNGQWSIAAMTIGKCSHSFSGHHSSISALFTTNRLQLPFSLLNVDFRWTHSQIVIHFQIRREYHVSRLTSEVGTWGGLTNSQLSLDIPASKLVSNEKSSCDALYSNSSFHSFCSWNATAGPLQWRQKKQKICALSTTLWRVVMPCNCMLDEPQDREPSELFL